TPATDPDPPSDCPHPAAAVEALRDGSRVRPDGLRAPRFDFTQLSKTLRPRRLLDHFQGERTDAHGAPAVRVLDPRAGLDVAHSANGHEGPELLDLELERAVHHRGEHLDLLLLVHPLLDHVHRDGLVSLPTADEGQEELTCS